MDEYGPRWFCSQHSVLPLHEKISRIEKLNKKCGNRTSVADVVCQTPVTQTLQKVMTKEEANVKHENSPLSESHCSSKDSLHQPPNLPDVDNEEPNPTYTSINSNLTLLQQTLERLKDTHSRWEALVNPNQSKIQGITTSFHDYHDLHHPNAIGKSSREPKPTYTSINSSSTLLQRTMERVKDKQTTLAGLGSSPESIVTIPGKNNVERVEMEQFKTREVSTSSKEMDHIVVIDQEDSSAHTEKEYTNQILSEDTDSEKDVDEFNGGMTGNETAEDKQDYATNSTSLGPFRFQSLELLQNNSDTGNEIDVINREILKDNKKNDGSEMSEGMFRFSVSRRW